MAAGPPRARPERVRLRDRRRAHGLRHVRVAIGLALTESGALTLASPALEERERGITARIAASPYLSCFPPSFDLADHEVRRYRDRAVDTPAGPLPDWWQGDERPLVYVTFGSVAGAFAAARPLFGEAVRQVAALPVRVLLTLGRELEVGEVPENVHVEEWVPQADVLGHAAAVVHHGGSGTTLGALAHGVPAVVVPLFVDQPFNAIRVTATGAGLHATVDEIGSRLERILAEPSYRAGAGAARRRAPGAAARRALPRRPAMSVPVPPVRHLLRAKDLIDARYRDPLDVAAARAGRAPLPRPLQPRVPPRVRRDAAPVPADAPAGARRGAAPPHRPLGGRDLLDVGLRSVGSFTTSFGRAYGMSPTAYRAAYPPAVPSARVPTCVAAGVRPSAVQQVSRRQPRARLLTSLVAVRTTLEERHAKRLTYVNVWVHDQDEALAFYTEKLGMELREDVTVPEMGNFRWLTVGVPGQESRAGADRSPARPSSTRRRGEQLQKLVAKGAAGRPLLRDRRRRRARTRSSRAAASSSPRSRRSSPTASTPASATPPGTRSGWCSSPTSGSRRGSGGHTAPAQTLRTGGRPRGATPTRGRR